MRLKLILMFVGSTVLTHFVVGQIAERSIKTYFFDTASRHLDNKFKALNKQTSDFTRPRTIRRLERETANIWNIEDNKIAFQNSPLTLPMVPSAFVLNEKSAKFTHRWKDAEGLYIASSFFINDKRTLVIGVNIDHHLEFFEAVNTLIFWFTVAVSVLAGIYSTVIVNNALRPLKRFEQHLARIRPGRLDIRIPTKKLPSELETLSHVQNSMLDRLDLGFQRLSDFSTDIAHELRTPLTNMTTQTQVALSKDRDITEYQSILGSNLEELERINKTINDTLYLAKAENSLLYQQNEDLDLAKEIAQIIEFQEIVAEEKGIDITLNGKAQLYADKLMLQRAISNLISNAIRHSSDDSTIAVTLNQTDKALKIAIANSGDTISKENLPLIFDRFFRADCSRGKGIDCGTGAGLGLAITRSIVETFAGSITAQSENGKTVFEITIPNRLPPK